MRLKGSGIRFTAKQLQAAEMVIKRVIKSTKGARVYTRVAANIPVCVKGNEVCFFFLFFDLLIILDTYGKR